MSNTQVENHTRLAFEPALLAYEEGRPIIVPMVVATHTVKDHSRLVVADEQVPVNLAGEYWGAPDTSSYKYEPEVRL